jgi:hypothetical protein
MAVPRLAVLLVVGVLLIPAAFVMSRVAAGGEQSPPPPKAVKAAPKAAPAFKPTDKAEAADGKAAAPAQPKPDPAAAARKKAAAAGLPASVAVALAHGNTVVLLLSDDKSADDHSTADAVHSLKGKVPNVKIFSDRLSRLGSYRAIVSRVGVSQSPAVVIVRGSKARVVEGYVDPETLRQQVIDAKR